MSCTEIYSFGKDGFGRYEGEVRNAWRGAMAIWRIMEERHLPPLVMFGRTTTRLTSPELSKEIWGLCDNKSIPEHERIVLLTTMDKCLVRKENFPRLIEAFRKFDGATSLPEQADILEKLIHDDDCIAVGWNQTDISESFWCGWGSDEDKTNSSYNCLTRNEHFWLFDDLNQEAQDGEESNH